MDTIFGLLGDANLFLMDSFQRVANGRFVSLCHEASSVMAAHGYAHTSGKIGVATVTHGPGLTNLHTPLVDAVRDRTPILVLAGDTPIGDEDHFQDIDQRAVVLSTGAGFEFLRTPEDICRSITFSIQRAQLERRPIVLNIPVDFQWHELDAIESSHPVPLQRFVIDSGQLELAASLVATAARPIVLAGRGASSAAAGVALSRLAERIGAPVATTVRGKGIFTGNSHHLGIFGTLAHDLASETIARSDCVIAFGASLNRWTTADGSLLDGKALVHVDSDPTALGKWAKPNAQVVGDCVEVSESLVALLDDAEVRPTSFASVELAGRLVTFETEPVGRSNRAGCVDVRSALRMVNDAVPTSRTLVIDDGRFILPAFRMLDVKDTQAYVHTVNFASIGLAIGNAIGAYSGSPERPVLAVCGDGGFMLGGLSEFNSAVRHSVDLIVVVLNDGAYGAEHVQFRERDMDPAITTFDWPDLGPVADALGGRGFTVRSVEELRDALSTLESRDRPVLIDVKIDPDSVPVYGH